MSTIRYFTPVFSPGRGTSPYRPHVNKTVNIKPNYTHRGDTLEGRQIVLAPVHGA